MMIMKEKMEGKDVLGTLVMVLLIGMKIWKMKGMKNGELIDLLVVQTR